MLCYVLNCAWKGLYSNLLRQIVAGKFCFYLSTEVKETADYSYYSHYSHYYFCDTFVRHSHYLHVQTAQVYWIVSWVHQNKVKQWIARTFTLPHRGKESPLLTRTKPWAYVGGCVWLNQYGIQGKKKKNLMSSELCMFRSGGVRRYGELAG